MTQSFGRRRVWPKRNMAFNENSWAALKQMCPIHLRYKMHDNFCFWMIADWALIIACIFTFVAYGSSVTHTKDTYVRKYKRKFVFLA